MDKQRIKALAATGVVAVLGVWGLTSLSGSDTNTKKTDSAQRPIKKQQTRLLTAENSSHKKLKTLKLRQPKEKT